MTKALIAPTIGTVIFCQIWIESVQTLGEARLAFCSDKR
jgi:hypothetical protein